MLLQFLGFFAAAFILLILNSLALLNLLLHKTGMLPCENSSHASLIFSNILNTNIDCAPTGFSLLVFFSCPMNSVC